MIKYIHIKGVISMSSDFIGKNEFLLKYNKRKEFESVNFKDSGLTWEDLLKINDNYLSLKSNFDVVRLKYSAELQKFPEVHAIRSRLKDNEHLIEKIIRKVAKTGKRIDDSNYLENITDIIGIRLIHISRYQSFPLFIKLCETFKGHFKEPVSIKIREGDDQSQYEQLLLGGATIQPQKRYRSIHYTVGTECSAIMEIQTRTLFEEGWSEIDHDSLYKAEERDKIVELSSTILSRLVGTCDDMAELMLKSTEIPFNQEVNLEKKASGRYDLLTEFIKNC